MREKIGLLVSLLFAVSVLSVTNSSLVGAETTTTTSTTADTTAETVKPDNKELLQRLIDRKTRLKTVLTAAETAKLKLKCVPSQTGSLRSLSGRIQGIETSRREVHKNLVNRLEKLVEKLKVKNVDTAELEAEIVVLKAKIATFDANLSLYKQAITDLKSMGCVTDPVSFKASLETARTLRETLVMDSAAIKSYVKDTIKPTIKAIRTALAATELKSTDTTGGNQ